MKINNLKSFATHFYFFQFYAKKKMIKFYFFLLSIMQKNKNVYFLPVYQKNTPFFGGTIKK